MKITAIVVGSLGGIPKQFGNRLKQIGITAETAQVQKFRFSWNGYNIAKGS